MKKIILIGLTALTACGPKEKSKSDRMQEYADSLRIVNEMKIQCIQEYQNALRTMKKEDAAEYVDKKMPECHWMDSLKAGK